MFSQSSLLTSSSCGKKTVVYCYKEKKTCAVLVCFTMSEVMKSASYIRVCYFVGGGGVGEICIPLCFSNTQPMPSSTTVTQQNGRMHRSTSLVSDQ